MDFNDTSAIPMEINNQWQTLNGLALPVEFKPTSNIWETVYIAGTAQSSFSTFDQEKLDQVLYSQQNILTPNVLFDRLKEYENRYGMDSDIFIGKWAKGSINPSVEFFDWASAYRDLYQN